jgi:Superfamily I DNA and RNA helicases and helicase subunits
MVAAPNERIGPLTKLTDKRRFNVAASRARDQLWLFHTVSLNDLNQNDLRYTLLNYCLHPQTQRITPEGINVDELRVIARNARRNKDQPPKPFESWFELDVFLEIVARCFRVIPQFHFAEYRIDLVVEGIMGRLAVECDGDEFHGAERFEEDLTRQRILERCGWRFWRVRASSFYRDPTKALDSLWPELDRLGIESIADFGDSAAYMDGYAPNINDVATSSQYQESELSEAEGEQPPPERVSSVSASGRWIGEKSA